MRSKVIQRIMHFLIICVGAGAGAAIAYLCVQVQKITLAWDMQLWHLITLYVVMCLLGALLGHLAARPVIRWFGEQLGRVERLMDTLSTAQKAAMVVGVIMGFLVAALLSQILHFLGESILTLAISAALYVVCGVAGLSIGVRCTDDFSVLLNTRTSRRDRRETPQTENPSAKVLDSSALIDGRIRAVRKAGFLEGEMVIPAFVLDELRHLADSPDAMRRERGKRGLDAAEQLKNESGVRVYLGDGYSDEPDADVRLLMLVRDMNGALVSSDHNLTRAARVAGLRVLNLNDLTCALRTVTAAGDVLSVRVTKEGREAGQGVGYLEDGTMIVVEGGRERVGDTVNVTVTSVLQTSAGRMVFARINEEA